MRGRKAVHRKNIPVRAGFTLVEMMIILLIIGIMAGLAAPPMFRYVQSNNLRTTADRMMADMNYARSLAISNDQVLQFRVDANGYQILDPISDQVLRGGPFKKGLKLDTPQTANFFPWGMADGTVFNLSNGSGNRQITLLPTGLVEVQ